VKLWLKQQRRDAFMESVPPQFTARRTMTLPAHILDCVFMIGRSGLAFCMVVFFCTWLNVGCIDSGDVAGPAIDADSFAYVFEAGQYERALKIARMASDQSQEDGSSYVNSALCLTMLERYEDAVEAFRIGESVNASACMSRVGLYLRAKALLNAKLFMSAQDTLDKLVSTHPYSKMAEEGQDLALRVQKRLNEGITRSNLNWYLDRGITSHNSARPALAVEYLEEYLRLAARGGLTLTGDDNRANFSLGGAYIELGLGESAVECLVKVPPEYMEYQAAILTAIAFRATGDHEVSDRLFALAANKSVDSDVRTRAINNLKQSTEE